jgi:chemotaxis signal transduction protein
MLVLTCQVGAQRLAVDVRQVHEVVPWVPLQASPDASPWLAGLLVHRGRTAPVIDLHRLLGAGDCPQLLSSRILLATSRSQRKEQLFGVLAARLAEVRELPLQAEASHDGGHAWLGPIIVRENQVWRLLDLGWLGALLDSAQGVPA